MMAGEPKHSRALQGMALAFVALFVCANLSALSGETGKDEMGYPTNSAAARELGIAEARRDLSNGVLIVKTAGLPSLERPDYEHLLKERCNVTLQPIAGCLVTSGLQAYLSGYNEVATLAIQQRFGTNIFAELDQEASARYQKRFAQTAPHGQAVGQNQPPTSNSTACGPTTFYAVKPGDTLTKIARAHGISLDELSRANPRVDPTRLQVSQKLIIPAKSRS